MHKYHYKCNTPINYIDPTGHASQTFSVKGKEVTHQIKFWFTTITIKSKIERNGYIRMPFKGNNYWGVLCLGGSTTLAESIYKAAKSINKNAMKGRTITGIDTELKLHYAGYVLFPKNTPYFGKRVQDSGMGGVLGSYSDGQDPNAWFFESVNAYKIAKKIALGFFGGTIKDSLKEVGKYF